MNNYKELLLCLSEYQEFKGNKKMTAGTEASTQGNLYWLEIQFEYAEGEFACITFYSYKINPECPEIEYYVVKDGNYSHEMTKRQFFNLIK